MTNPKTPAKKIKTPVNPETQLAKLGITNPDAALLYFPLRFENHTQLTPIGSLRDGQVALIQGKISDSQIISAPGARTKKQWVLSLSDGSGSIQLRFLNFYPKQVAMYEVARLVRAYGTARSSMWAVEMVHPTTRLVSAQTPLEQSLTAIYSTQHGIAQSLINRVIGQAMPRLNTTAWQEYLSHQELQQHDCANLSDSITYLHRPPPEFASAEQLQAYEERRLPQWRRIKLDELIAQQTALQQIRQQRIERQALALSQLTQTQALVDQLPFRLTQAQQRAWKDISADLTHQTPMQRLLQGDVGSGKTVIAILAALQAIENGTQVAFMAPTELLAEQLYHKCCEYLTKQNIKPVWLAGSLSKAKKKAAQQSIEQGAPLVVGTHALIQDGISFPRLGLVVIDEQHRFGVVQRIRLFDQTPQNTVPHLLMMSATPIPRTLTMTYFADLDVSVMKERPPGRSDIDTRVIQMARLEEVLQGVRHAMDEGRQVYWVCPLIEESEKLSLQDVLTRFEWLSAQLPGVSVGLLHGRLSTSEKNEVMESFRSGSLRLLVATTVIEVGVDVPNASLMIIENAERFGLAQLHQLRGRVGRGSIKSHCWLLYDTTTIGSTGKARLAMLRKSQDGFEIANEDLRLRGPGELLGEQQAGQAMLRYANLQQDEDLIRAAQQISQRLHQEKPAQLSAILARWHRDQHAFWAG